MQYVTTDKLSNPTPCTEWDLKALLNHMVYELLWIPDILEGKTVKEVGDKYDGDVLGDDLAGAWRRAAELAETAVKLADEAKIVHLSYADKPAGDYIIEVGGDIFIHSWDADQAMQCTLLLDPEVAQTIYDSLLPRKEELHKSGLFAPPKEVADDATIQVKLLALTGRKALA